MHDTISIFPVKSFRDANRPNHFRMRIWPIAVFATKSYLQAFRQKRRPQWLWRTRPNFLPQFAQRFSNLVMKLSTDLEADGPRLLTVRPLPEACADYVCDCRPRGLLIAANSLLFWANGLFAAVQ